MVVVLIILVPLAILFAWAVVLDLKRRRRHVPGVDVASRVKAVKVSAQAKALPGPDGGSGT